ncbi:hypothetical protein FB446DRAFT_617580, partial [Lentinula raphanica]
SSSYDFALADNGARVLPALTSSTVGLGPPSFLSGLIAVARGFDKSHIHINPPRVVIEEHVSATSCWKFAGSQGHIAIQMSTPIHWNGVTMHFPEHEIVGEKLGQSPRAFALWALVSKGVEGLGVENVFADWEEFVIEKRLLESSIFNSTVTFIRVAEFTYEFWKGTRQRFDIPLPLQTAVVLVQILENRGDPFTCVYRIAFHG